jgi:hypothetical protein
MRLDRRDFMRIGAAGILVGAGCDGTKKASQSAAAPGASVASLCDLLPSPPGPPHKVLEVQFKGLFLIEHDTGTKSATIHLLDGQKLNIPMPHIARMSAFKSTIDETQTQRPDSDHVTPAGNDEIWCWDLQGKAVTIVDATGGTPDLDVDETSSDDPQEMPASDAGWASLVRVPDLKVAFGATGLIPNVSTYYVTTIALSHGHFGPEVPGSKNTDIGPNAVWKFEDPRNGAPTLFQRALTDRVLYTLSTQNKSRTITVDNVQIVFKPDVHAPVTISNAPGNIPCGTPCKPDMDDFHYYRALVAGSQFDPTITLAKFTPPPQGNAGSNYCPGGRI